jgi:hypothetical protein
VVWGGVSASLVGTLSIRPREIALADIATVQGKREEVQILLPAPFVYIAFRAD